MSEKTKNSIVYLSIISSDNDPILMKNYNNSCAEEINFQLNTIATLDLIQSQVIKQQNNYDGNTSVSSYLGCLNSIYLSEDEFDIYGYTTGGNLKIILILRQKNNFSNYEERHINVLMSDIYTLYKQNMLNPFDNSQDDYCSLSKNFHKKLDDLVNKYQDILKKGI